MAYTRKKFHRLLQEYVDAGLTDRIMFGSDGHSFARAFAAYESADFLSRRQLEGIFCRNAERFLGKRGYCDGSAAQPLGARPANRASPGR
jgi:predicted TIM-barrel fold metal-dependent hydrolase